MKTPLSELIEPGMVGIFQDGTEEAYESDRRVLTEVQGNKYICHLGEYWRLFDPEPVQLNGFPWDGRNPEGPDWDGVITVLYQNGAQRNIHTVAMEGRWEHDNEGWNVIRFFPIPKLKP